MDDAIPTDLQSGKDEDAAPARQEAPDQTPPVLGPAGATAGWLYAQSGGQVDTVTFQEGLSYWNSMTGTDQAEAAEDFQRLVVPHLIGALSQQQFGDDFSSGGHLSGELQVLAGSGSPMPLAHGATDQPDQDEDGLSDGLEDALAAGFIPHYAVSAFEHDTIGFAEFFDQDVQVVKMTYGSTPVRSKYRVRPLGFRTAWQTGIQYGFLQIDFLTLWNGDIGLQVMCRTPFVGIANGLLTLSASRYKHYIDNEWSSILVAAPTVLTGDSNTRTYNTDAFAYRAYWARMSAHEDTPNDLTYYRQYVPGGVPLGSHVLLYLSKDKHATYHVNPDGVPLLARYFPYAVMTLDFLAWLFDWSRRTYCIFYFILVTLFFDCYTENVIGQGIELGQSPTNVGELSNPADGFRYIRQTSDDKSRLGDKLGKLIWAEKMDFLDWLAPGDGTR